MFERLWLSTGLPGGKFTAFLLVITVMFLLGFFLDFIEIIFMIVPIVGAILIALGFSPLWLGVMIGLNLQTSFFPPFRHIQSLHPLLCSI